MMMMIKRMLVIMMTARWILRVLKVLLLNLMDVVEAVVAIVVVGRSVNLAKLTRRVFHLINKMK